MYRFSVIGPIKNNQIIIPVELFNPDFPNKVIPVKALIDTGATITSLTNDLVEKLLLEKTDLISVTSTESIKIFDKMENLSIKVATTNGVYTISKNICHNGLNSNSGYDILIGMSTILVGELRIFKDGTYIWDLPENVNVNVNLNLP